MIPHRRFHTKSRFGCAQCKKSRTKCDENRPECGRCRRKGSYCSLADQASGLIVIPAQGTKSRKAQTRTHTEAPDNNAAPNGTHLRRSIDPTQSLSPTRIPLPLPSAEQAIVEIQLTDIEREQLQLMHHYTVHTSKSIAEVTILEDQDQSLWNQWAIELAFKNDFLLHGLLSLSALHLALGGSSPQKHTVAAIRHQHLAVSLFRPYLSQLAVDNYDAVFAFSYVVAFYSFGIQRTSESDINPIAKLHQVLSLVRGISTFFKSDLESLGRSRWSGLSFILRHPFTRNLPEEMETMLSDLRQRTSRTTSGSVRGPMYIAAIEALKASLTFAITYPSAQSSVTLFSVMVPAEFWAMATTGEPLALAILANYAVTLYWLRDNIWMRGWGKEIVATVRQALPLEWHQCIAWAIQQTESA
ncbi:hypothetical protein A1O3_02733 [Capronia epimyces CBS 606.96]|uniref:Zn(2)-C6 fungal-type domain-containing protein n=1 Tax=Capronia epimyces CBS 606.96 TaxID=1182542 RepID=W9YK92_9EURO|nr:uncharacterized protein A1O3_02733 [Capronia epimyces CBS 606.96]EXJ89666.1 hypothetical protein A1O3_02733 [Capronia epimyces CBS 606.96]